MLVYYTYISLLPLPPFCYIIYIISINVTDSTVVIHCYNHCRLSSFPSLLQLFSHPLPLYYYYWQIYCMDITFLYVVSLRIHYIHISYAIALPISLEKRESIFSVFYIYMNAFTCLFTFTLVYSCVFELPWVGGNHLLSARRN